MICGRTQMDDFGHLWEYIAAVDLIVSLITRERQTESGVRQSGIRKPYHVYSLFVTWSSICSCVGYHPRTRRAKAFDCCTVCQHCLCFLTFESLDVETSFLVRGYIFRISRSISCIKVIGSRSRSQKQKCVCVFCLGCNFWTAWPTNFIIGMQLRLHNI